MTDERLKEIDIKLRDYGRLNTKIEKRGRYLKAWMRGERYKHILKRMKEN